MANHHSEGHGAVHHNPFDFLGWPMALTSPLVWPVMPWAGWLWAHVPTPTALYMAVSFIFMLFQMSDRMGWLERLKRRSKYDNPDKPEG